jgi:hypothetical protein
MYLKTLRDIYLLLCAFKSTEVVILSLCSPENRCKPSLCWVSVNLLVNSS